MTFLKIKYKYNNTEDEDDDNDYNIKNWWLDEKKVRDIDEENIFMMK